MSYIFGEMAISFADFAEMKRYQCIDAVSTMPAGQNQIIKAKTRNEIMESIRWCRMMGRRVQYKLITTHSPWRRCLCFVLCVWVCAYILREPEIQISIWMEINQQIQKPMNMFRDEFAFGELFDVSHSIGSILNSFVSLVRCWCWSNVDESAVVVHRCVDGQNLCLGNGRDKRDPIINNNYLNLIRFQWNPITK